MGLSRGKCIAFVWLVVAGPVCIARPSLALENIDNFELSPEQLFQATVVSASKTSEKLMDAPAAIFVLTNEDIIRSGATSIPDALRQVPGVQVAQINANNWAVSIRGFNGALANKLLVLVDGREVYDPLFSGVYWDIQDLVLEDIDRIEVVRGPGASLWGANAVDGVINIITKKAEDTQGNLLSFTNGNQAHAIVEGRHGGTLGDDGYYRVYGKYVNLADEETPSNANSHDGQTEERSGFRADWKNPASSKDDYTFQGDAYQSNDGDLRSVPTFTAPFSQLQTEHIGASGGNMLGRWTHTLSEDSHFTLQSYADYSTRDQIIIGDQRTNFDVDAQYELPAQGAHKIIVGGGYRYSFDELTASPYASFTNDGEATNLLSGFVQDKITLEPKTWFLTLGSKFEHNDFTGFEIQPSARLQWQPDETQMVWSSISRAVRTPSRLEHDLTLNEAVLPVAGLPAELLLRPDPDLQSEKLVAYEVGYRNQLTPKVLVDLTAFYNDYQSLSTLSFQTPSFASLPFLFPITTTNNTHGETHGFEAVTDWRVRDDLKLFTSYSVLAMHLFGPPENIAVNSEAAQTQSPSQQFNIGSRWDVTKTVLFDSTLYYTSNLAGLQVPEYWRWDARLSWKVMEGLQFSLVGQNLLNGEHREFSSPTDAAAAEIGRSIYGNFTWRF